MYFIPIPSLLCNKIGSIFKLCILNCFPTFAKKTTGNSSPLLLCILIILITLSFSPINFADPKSPLPNLSLSINFIKLYNPLKLACSYCFALSNNALKFACLKFPFGINPQ